MMNIPSQNTPPPRRDGNSDDWVFTKQGFGQIAEIAKENFGLNLSESKMKLIQSRLAKRMTLLSLTDFEQYLARLKGPKAADERVELLSVLTTNVTHFFREPHHFKTLRESVLPPLLDRARQGHRVRIWSAGCSTGQEAFSLAMTLMDMCPDIGFWDVKLLATDIDPVVIKTANAAEYSEADLGGVSAALAKKYVGRGAREGGVGKINEAVQKLITFKVLNLIEPLPFGGPFDVIFCRNVAIYFDRATQAAVWQQFEQVTKPGAHLFIGHSEHVSGPAKPCFEKSALPVTNALTRPREGRANDNGHPKTHWRAARRLQIHR